MNPFPGYPVQIFGSDGERVRMSKHLTTLTRFVASGEEITSLHGTKGGRDGGKMVEIFFLSGSRARIWCDDLTRPAKYLAWCSRRKDEAARFHLAPAHGYVKFTAAYYEALARLHVRIYRTREFFNVAVMTRKKADAVYRVFTVSQDGKASNHRREQVNRSIGVRVKYESAPRRPSRFEDTVRGVTF